jgi:hypothetical protein
VLFMAWSVRVGAEERPAHPAFAEPIVTETVTDLDGAEGGELEVELNASTFRAMRGGAWERLASLEIEWLVTRKLGLRLEPSYSKTTTSGGLGTSGAASWKLFQDWVNDRHLQAEVEGRVPWDPGTTVTPGDPALPFALGVRSGIREGRWTLRAGLGFDAGGHAAHVPIRGSLALLTGILRDERFGVFGIEMDADGARVNPVVLAANLIADVTPLGLPFKFGIATPWGVGVQGTDPSLGLLVRIFYVSDREAELGGNPR